MSLPIESTFPSPASSPAYETGQKAALVSTRRSDKVSTFEDADLDDDLFGDASQRSHSSALDRKDMHRLGKPQEFSRNYRALSTLSFTIVVQGTWEFILLFVLPFLAPRMLRPSAHITCLQINDPRTNKRWTCWPILVLCLDFYRIHTHRCLSRGDGIHGAHKWRTVCAGESSHKETCSNSVLHSTRYHWVSEFAPERYQKILSYVTGMVASTASLEKAYN